MPENKQERTGPADRGRINVHEPSTLEYWAAEWGVSTAAVRDSVRRVGTMTVDVKRDLEKW